MKKKFLFPLSILALLTLVGCNGTNGGTHTETSEDLSGSYFSSVTVPSVSNIEEPEISGDFSLTTSDGTFTSSNNIYTITSAGSYTAKGTLEGQIVIEANEDEEVELVLEGASITYDKDSPIKALSGDKLEIKAKADTENLVKDNRSNKTVDNEEVGEGAINAKIDLKLKGSGTLVVEGNYNNGVHTSDDLTVQNLTLQATAYNNALKGNDSITVNSGTIYAYSKNGQGLKTKNSDVSSKGNQRGTIQINGGTIYSDSLYDGLDASYNVVIDELDETVPTNVTIKTGTKSKYYSSSKFDKTASAKGLKADNEIIVNKGTVVVAGSDDAVHANYGTALENGATGLGNITVNGGALSVASGDDGFHADNTLAVSGGQVVVTGATEGFEANHIKISGGYSYIYGNDDGVNASKKINQTPTIEITGGVLDVSVSNGDTDGIDSNGNYTQSGGVVISRGAPGTAGSGMSTGLDCDGTASITGGTFIAFNGLEKTPSTSSNVLKAATNGSTSQMGPGGNRQGGQWGGNQSSSNHSFSAGEYTLKGTDLELTFTNNYQYGSFLIYSSSLVGNANYTLTNNGSTVLSWSQTSNNVTIS